MAYSSGLASGHRLMCPRSALLYALSTLLRTFFTLPCTVSALLYTYPSFYTLCIPRVVCLYWTWVDRVHSVPYMDAMDYTSRLASGHKFMCPRAALLYALSTLLCTVSALLYTVSALLYIYPPF